MERRKAEDRQKILKRKVIQKLYQPTEIGNGLLKNAQNAVRKSTEHQDSAEPVVKAFKADTDTSYYYDLKMAREEKSNCDGLKFGNEVDHKSTCGVHESTVNNSWNNDKLSPYLTDDEGSDEKSVKKRKRKRRHHHVSANPRVAKRSSSTSSSSSQVPHSDTPAPFAFGLSSRLTQNQRRKLKRKKRKRDCPAQEGQGVVYTYKKLCDEVKEHGYVKSISHL